MRSPRPSATKSLKPTTNTMPKYRFELEYVRRESIVVEADTLAEARERVDSGEFFPEHIVYAEDDHIQLSEGEEVK